ncbi:Chitinase, putative [hydrothermal vent metagenome]|uniref:Chitinase, putative n=1 Tax=hydrothermal vent metagenome TaxID=652676 RepID=A0A1W1BCI5_9ZZZZ
MTQYTKKLTGLFVSLLALFFLNACGSTGASSDTKLVGDTTQQTAPYEIDAHQGTTAVVHATTDHDVGTHSWTQVSGPSVELSATDTPTATFSVPTDSTTPIVLQHTHTDPQTGVTTVTTHTVTPIAVPQSTPTPTLTPLIAVVSKPANVYIGTTASLHASAYGGIPPYSYTWTAPNNIVLDIQYPNAPHFKVDASLTVGDTLTFGLVVGDSNGSTVSSSETVTVQPAQKTPPLLPTTPTTPTKPQAPQQEPLKDVPNCNGMMDCFVNGDQLVDCPPEKPYLMQSIIFGDDGSISPSFTCEDFDTCRKKWWQETSDDSACTSIMGKFIQPLYIDQECHYCAVSNNPPIVINKVIDHSQILDLHP